MSSRNLDGQCSKISKQKLTSVTLELKKTIINQQQNMIYEIQKKINTFTEIIRGGYKK